MQFFFKRGAFGGPFYQKGVVLCFKKVKRVSFKAHQRERERKRERDPTYICSHTPCTFNFTPTCCDPTAVAPLLTPINLLRTYCDPHLPLHFHWDPTPLAPHPTFIILLHKCCNPTPYIRLEFNFPHPATPIFKLHSPHFLSFSPHLATPHLNPHFPQLYKLAPHMLRHHTCSLNPYSLF